LEIPYRRSTRNNVAINVYYTPAYAPMSSVNLY